MTKREFKKKEIIFREGDTGDTLYQINDGAVGIYASYGDSDQRLLTELSKGKIFGEMAVIEAYPRSATAVALEDTEVDEISAGEYGDYFKDRPDKLMEIMRSLGGRLRDLTADFDEVSSAIKQVDDGEGQDKSEGLVDKIKKFADVFKKSKSADAVSAESLRKLEQSGHSDGFNTKVETYNKGTIIIKDGEDGECMYDVHYGSVGIYVDYGKDSEKLVTKLGVNQFFGELGLVEDVRRSATAVVLEDGTTLEIIDFPSLLDIFKQNPPKFQMILEHLSYRLRKLTKDYLEACGIMYRIYESGYKGAGLEGDLKNDVKDYLGHIYE